MNKTAAAVGMIGLGSVILWSGVTNAGIVASLQSLLHGVAPTPGTPQAPVLGSVLKNAASAVGISQTNVGGTSVVGNGAIAQTALRYNGCPYVWGGTNPPPAYGGNGVGLDCYGLLTWVLHHDLGYSLPNNTHSGYLEFLAWGGATRVDKTSIQAGDLLIWPTHSGIAVSSTEMISAENPQNGTRVDTFANGGPLAPEPLTVLRVGGGAVAYA